MIRVLGVACALVLAACSSTPTATPTLTPSETSSISTQEPSPSATPSVTGATASAEPSETEKEKEPNEPSATGAPTDPPRAGLYRYAQSGETKAGIFTLNPDPEGTLRISKPNGVRQKQVRKYSSTQDLEQVLLYREAGVFIKSFKSNIASGAVECTFEKPLLVVELPLEIGNSWDDKGTCDKMTMRVRGIVRSTEQRTVAGKRINTFVLKLTIDVTSDRLEQRQVQTLWVSQKYRLIVRAVENSEGTIDGQDFTSNRTDRLLNLEPE